MVGLVLLLIVIVAVVAALVFMSMRETVAEIEDADIHLHDPDTPTVLYQVPDGVDAAALKGVLHVAGFESVVDPSPTGTELVRVECEPPQRERVREVIAHVPVGDGPDVETTFGPVRFVDEAVA